MIGQNLKDLFNEPTANIITPASEVAVVREDDTLLHAIIVLSNRGYQTIPVLDQKDRVRGLISISKIVLSSEDVTFFNEDILTKTKVSEVMDQIVPILFDNSELEDILRLMINNNFICITHRNGYFVGIITRKTIIERFTNIAHNLENEYKLIKKLK